MDRKRSVLVLSSVEFPSANDYDHPVDPLADVSLLSVSFALPWPPYNLASYPYLYQTSPIGPRVTFRRLNNYFIAEITTHNTNPNICPHGHPIHVYRAVL